MREESSNDAGRDDHARPAALRSGPIGRILLTVLLVGTGVQFGVVHPGQNYLLDFRAYYAAGYALRHDLNPYDTAALQQQVQPLLPGDQPLVEWVYPPPTLPIAYALALLPLPASQVAWCLFQFGLLVGALLLTFRALDIGFGSPVSVLITVVFILGIPVDHLFRWGQWDGIVVFLLAAAACTFARGRSAAGGALLGLAAVAKLFPAFYLVLPLLRRRWSALVAGVGVAAGLMVVSLPFLTPATRTAYLHNTTMKLGSVAYTIPPANLSIFGYVYRATIDWAEGRHATTPWIDLGFSVAWWIAHALAAALVLGTFAWLARQRHRLTSAESLAVLIPVALLVTPVSWPHHFVQMLLPLAVAAAIAARQPRLGALDAAFLVAIFGLYLFNPVLTYRVELPDALEHLLLPTTMYSAALLWAFLLVRYRPLKDAAERLEPHGGGAPTTRTAARPPTPHAVGAALPAFASRAAATRLAPGEKP